MSVKRLRFKSGFLAACLQLFWAFELLLPASDAQLPLLANLPNIFGGQNNFEANPRPKKSPELVPKNRCCQMVQIVSDGIGVKVLPGKLVWSSVKLEQPHWLGRKLGPIVGFSQMSLTGD